MRHLANSITISRILLSVILLPTKTFTLPFYFLYIYCGVSDMVDGVIARRTDSTSRAGASLDSIADILFTAVCMVKILPVLELKNWMWEWIGIIILIKIINLVYGFICCRKMVFLHTVGNKVTGILLFLWVIINQWIPKEISVFILCATATFAAVQEGHIIRTGKTEEFMI